MDQSPDIKTGLDNTIVFASRKGAAVVLTFFAAGITCETYLWDREADETGRNLIACVDTAEMPFFERVEFKDANGLCVAVNRGAPNRVIFTFVFGAIKNAFHLSHAAAKELGEALCAIAASGATA